MSQKKKEVIVTCNQAEGSVRRVAEELRGVGFEVDSVLEFAGSISGKWSDSLEKLRKIPEVVAVEESKTMYPQ